MAIRKPGNIEKENGEPVIAKRIGLICMKSCNMQNARTQRLKNNACAERRMEERG